MIRCNAWLVGLFLALLLAACRPAPNGTHGETPPPDRDNRDNLPIPSAQPGEVMRVPADQLSFLTYATNQTCAAACNCPAIEGLPTSFSIREENQVKYLQLRSNAIGAGWQQTLPPVLIASGDYLEKLTPLYALPFAGSLPFAILAVDEQGLVTIELDGRPHQLAPGAAWSWQSSHYRGGLCFYTQRGTLLNRGLWEQARVRLEP